MQLKQLKKLESMRSSLLWLSLSAAALGGCSGSGTVTGSSGNSGGNNGDVSTLQIVAPKTIFSKPTESSPGYIVVKNPTDTAVSNLHYSLNSLIGGAAGSEIDPASAAECISIPANSQCNVKVMIPAGAVAGSFGFSSNNDSNSSNILARLGKALKDSVNQTTALNIGIEQAAYNSLSGADGITLSYYRTVINGVPYIIVTGLVASATAGAFNNIVLVDGHGNAIPNQELISGAISSAQGSTFSILLPVPAGSGISQTIKVQTQQVSNGQTTVVSTATSSSTLTTTEGVGIVNMLPGAVYLTATNPEQTITFNNTGDAAAQLQSLIASNPNIEVVFTPGSLASGGTATAILRLKDSTLPATSGGVEYTYNNGQNEVSSSAVVEQNVNPAPSPSPTPTPTPTPTPPGPPAPVAGLTTTLSPDSDFLLPRQ